MERLTRVLDRIWNVDLLTPMVRFLRVLITVLAGIAVIGLLALTSKAGSERLIVFIAGMVIIGVVYIALMLTPDTCALVLNLERSTRRPAAGDEPVRYRGLHWLAALLRWSVLLTLLSLAAMAVGYVIDKTVAHKPFVANAFRRLESGGSAFWTLLQIVTVLVIVAGAIWMWKRDAAEGTRMPRPVTMLAALLALHSVAVLAGAIIDYRRTPRYYGYYDAPDRVLSLGAYTPIIVTFWIVAAFIAARGLIQGRWSEKQRFFSVGAVVIGGWMVLTRWVMTLQLPEAIATAVASLSPLGAGQRAQLIQIFGQLGYRAQKYVWPVLLLALAISCAIAWMKSDAARALERLERNLRPASEEAEPFSLHVMVASFAAKLVAAGIVIVGIAMLFTQSRAFARLDDIPDVLQPMVRQIFSAQPEWMMLKGVVLIFALLNVIQLTFDLASHTRASVARPPLQFFSLRFITGLQTLIALVCTIGIAVVSLNIIDKMARSLDSRGMVLVLRLLALAAAAFVYVVLTLVTTMIRNCIVLEANTRQEGDWVVRASARYPALSFVATFGKGLVILLTILLTIAALWAADQESSTLIVSVPAIFLTYVLLSAIPDFAALLLTIERNLAHRPQAVAEPAAVAIAPA